MQVAMNHFYISVMTRTKLLAALVLGAAIVALALMPDVAQAGKKFGP